MEAIKQAGSIGSNKTSTEHASSEPDNSQISTAPDTCSFHNSPSRSHSKSYKRRGTSEREDGLDTCYSRSDKEHDDWHMGKEKRRDDVHYYASRSYSEHEDRYRSKERDREHHNHRSGSVIQDTFDDRYDCGVQSKYNASFNSCIKLCSSCTLCSSHLILIGFEL
jgi:hypothetical protein